MTVLALVTLGDATQIGSFLLAKARTRKAKFLLKVVLKVHLHIQYCGCDLAV